MSRSMSTDAQNWCRRRVTPRTSAMGTTYHERSVIARGQFRALAAAARRGAGAGRRRWRRDVALRRGQRGQDHLLHVRVPMRHRRAPQGRQGPLHQRQQGPSGEPRRALRQGQRRHHAALQPGAAEEAAAAHRPARLRRVPRDRMGRSAGNSHGAPVAHTADRSEETRLLHRPRPVAVADRLVGLEIRHAELRRAWRLLLGQHGGRRASIRSAARSGSSASPTGTAPNTSCCSASPRTTIPTRSRSGSASSRRAARRSSRSIPAGPATTPSPTTGSASGRGRTGCSCWRSCTSF